MSQHSITEITKVTKTTKPGVYKLPNGKIVTHTGLETRVEQSHKKQCDLNHILEPAMKKNLLRHAVKFTGQYDDIPHMQLQEAMSMVAKAHSMYEELPGEIKAEFKTPDAFLAFAQNPQNAQRMLDMGILQGNDGRTADNLPSGAPTKTDMDGDGIADAPQTL